MVALNAESREKLAQKTARIVEAWNGGLNKFSMRDAAKRLKLPLQTLRDHLQRWAPQYGLEVSAPENKLSQARMGVIPRTEFHIGDLPDDDLDIEDIVALHKKAFEQKKKHEIATSLIKVDIRIKGPIGILHFGDPHVDDDGTDIGAIEKHSDLTNSVEGLFGANVGDTTNAWVGRLARLYGEQNCGRKRALKLAEWFIKRTKWLYMIAGNHDSWAGEDDPIKWISRQSGTLYRSSEARFLLQFPEGENFTINARHDFAGNSIYNPAHGAMKAIHFGVRDDLNTCGHKHISGYGILKDPISGKTCHALQVGSYKTFDRYAKEKGLRDQSLGPAALTVITPTLPPEHPDRCKVWWDPEEGADYLKYARKRKAA